MTCAVKAQPVELKQLHGSEEVLVGHHRICGKQGRKITCATLSEDTKELEIVATKNVDDGCIAQLGARETLCVLRADSVHCGAQVDNVVVDPPTPIKSLACGAGGICGVTENGDIYCSESGTAWNRVPILRGTQVLAVGHRTACAATDRGEVACWGSDVHGALGRVSKLRREPALDGRRLWANGAAICSEDWNFQGHTTTSCIGGNAKTPRAELARHGAVATYFDGHCKIDRTEANVRCTFADGQTIIQQLSKEKFDKAQLLHHKDRICLSTDSLQCLSSARGQMSWKQVDGFSGRATDLAVDMVGECFRQEDGQVWCSNSASWAGPLRSGVVSNVQNTQDIEGAGLTRCALLNGGRVFCWHAIEDFDAKDGAFIELGFLVEQLESTRNRYCARSDKRVACWGVGDLGQLNGEPRFSAMSFLSPSEVKGAPPLEHLTMTPRMTCGLTKQRKAWCWGPRRGEAWSPNPVVVGGPL